MSRGKRKISPFLFFFFLLISLGLSQPKVSAPVLPVLDWDTLKIDFHGKKDSIRLIGITALKVGSTRKPERMLKELGRMFGL
ncbi:MAG: hypothetical protein ABSF48_05955 [Thermodesulfobacteriota bacterium]|jgi:hypothetical protein